MPFKKLLKRKERDPMRESTAVATVYLLEMNQKFEAFVRDRIAELERRTNGLAAREAAKSPDEPDEFLAAAEPTWAPDPEPAPDWSVDPPVEVEPLQPDPLDDQLEIISEDAATVEDTLDEISDTDSMMIIDTPQPSVGSPLAEVDLRSVPTGNDLLLSYHHSAGDESETTALSLAPHLAFRPQSGEVDDGLSEALEVDELNDDDDEEPAEWERLLGSSGAKGAWS